MRNTTSGCRSEVSSCRHSRGFTLIEVLVVVAIIALLLSILLPSLRAARNQAKLVACAANLKQVATNVASYQTEFTGYVPVIFNDAASVNSGGSNPPARACWVSVALRKYAAQTRSLGQRDIGGVQYDFDPESVWDTATRNAYETRVMPEFYACPFQRGKGPQSRDARTEGSYRIHRKEGRFDSIQTWLWENVVRGQLPPHGVPWSPPSVNGRDGVPKYTAFSWNVVRPYPGSEGKFADGTTVPPVSNLYAGGSPTDPSKKTYRRWTDGDVRRLRSGSFSTTTVAYCAQGENILGSQPQNLIGWANPGSHPGSGIGGTNAIFADTHVEWVPGKQVGWP